MIENGKLMTESGVQVSVLPFQDLYITQNANGSLTHQGTKNTDNASRSTRRKLFAPVDVKCVRNISGDGLGLVLYHSINKVLLPTGEIDYISMWLMHDNTSEQFTVGTIYPQGTHIYTEGNRDSSGASTGIHVHVECAKGLHTDRVSKAPNGRYEIVNSSYIDDLFFVNMTDIMREYDTTYGGYQGYNWRTYDGGVTPPEPSGANNLYHLMLAKALPGFF